jgi:hypothetical protein
MHRFTIARYELAHTPARLSDGANESGLAPLTSRFRRILPQSRLDRFVNFVKFDIVEPFWPAHADQ